MKFEKKMRERGMEKLDSRAKNPYKTALKNRKTPIFPLWLKLGVPTSALATAAVIGIVLPLALNQNKPSPSSSTPVGNPSSSAVAEEGKPTPSTPNAPENPTSIAKPGDMDQTPTEVNGTRLNEPQKAFNQGSGALGQSYIDSIKGFANDFFSLAAGHKEKENDNIIFSPLSLASCFALAYEGANGETKEELSHAFHIDETSYSYKEETRKMLLETSVDKRNEKDGRSAFSNVSEAFFVDESFKSYLMQEYIDILTSYYYAEAFSGNLGDEGMHALLADYINGKTNDFFNLSKEDFKDLGGVLWLVNTVYLKANWNIDFYQGGHKPFHSLNGEVIGGTPFISSSYITDVYEWEDAYSFSIPLYGSYSMNVFYPKEEADQEKMTSYLPRLLSCSDYASVSELLLNLTLPLFKATNSFDLVKDGYLSGLGVHRATDIGTADFSKMGTSFPNEGLYIASASHDAGIEVSKEGIEAAAYTIIQMSGESGREIDIINITLDHPFLYSIVNAKDGLPMFVGQLSSI